MLVPVISSGCFPLANTAIRKFVTLQLSARIVNYYNVVGRDSTVERIELYMTNDTYFNRYPNSSALRVHAIDRAEAERHLEGAERWVCDGTKLRKG